ncbi:recombinase family protein [Mucilaginibacter paludis]|uniref:Resolvase domain-containing protein n=1 Tax=Mucilaginibacter paludis DSM 18603 TaxID=714943 RepID=H1Y467_9SPHI|nr:recombinase family protein [Mucilaginibacter paludis]EHQ24803.1 Resolvase domain-containing protein [Mucilaginibacter paludis DSM 18603]
MKIADLYIRVSTDEQADKGYSQRSQEEVLRRYCEFHHIQIRKVILEDHSAKTFNRPAWTTLLADLRKTKGRFSDLVLFTKWDRFSRNAGDAYQMISTLKTLGIEPQAIEQPLDLSIPENKLMLAIYLSTPEVENDRRALNVLHGMRRARKEGRWMASAPIGYKNAVTENGKKRIVPKEPEASILKFSFEKIATGQFSTEQIWKVARENGLRCGKNNFLVAMRNPVYCGKITVPKYKDEESHIVPGLHEPLISESLFYDVQEAMDGRKRQQGTKIMSKDELPLRGFLLCSKCTRVLTGSASKGRKQYYYYYHCCSKCGCRYKAEEVNQLFFDELQRYAPKPGIAEICKKIILDVYEADFAIKGDGRKELLEKIEELSNKQKKARELLLKGDLDGVEYREIKLECETKINALEAKLGDFSKSNISIEHDLDRAIKALTSLCGLYSLENMKLSRELIGSMYPEKFTLENLKDRTARVNEVAEIIYLISSELESKKEWASDEFSSLPTWVRPPGLEPNLVYR